MDNCNIAVCILFAAGGSDVVSGLQADFIADVKAVVAFVIELKFADIPTRENVVFEGSRTIACIEPNFRRFIIR